MKDYEIPEEERMTVVILKDYAPYITGKKYIVPKSFGEILIAQQVAEEITHDSNCE